MGARQDNVKWLDGLRGLASVLVVITHLVRAIDTDLFLPSSSSTEDSPRILQWPIIRVFTQGRIGVAIFSLVTGYVCGLKPLRQIRAGQTEAALIGVAKSAFRRIPRLVLPTTIITTFICLMTQVGVFNIARATNSQWLSYTAPEMSDSFSEAMRKLWLNIIETWVYGRNEYDPNQWTLQPLLRGSMLVYINIFALAYMQPRYRMVTSLGQWVYYYIGSDSGFGMQFFFGLFLADLQTSYPPQQQSEPQATSHLRPQALIAPSLILAGLFLASYPEDHAEYQSWSRGLQWLSTWLLPEGYDAPRYFTAFGLELIVLGIHFSPTVRKFLSNNLLLWLGRNSFAVYLLHGSLLRSVLTWMMYGIRMPKDFIGGDGQLYREQLQFQSRGGWTVLLCVPVWFCLLYACADLWTRCVDPWCARVTVALERYVTVSGDGEKRLGGGLLLR